MPIRVYIVEDHALMRETLEDYLVLSTDIELCGMAGSAEAAADELMSASADVVLLDLALPGRSGLELLKEIRERWGTPCVILSGHAERSYVARALAAGARGYVLKGRPAEVAEAVREAAGGGIYLSPSLPSPGDYLEDPSGG